MYRNGCIVTLNIRKEHFDGSDNLVLQQGTCGMVVQARRTVAGTPQEYVVDFGPYSQWNCTHDELSGQDSPGVTMGSDGEERLAVATSRSVPNAMLDNIRRDVEGDEDEETKDKATVIDFEADMARMVAKLEKEIC